MAYFCNLGVNLRDLFVRRTKSTPPHNPLISLTLQKYSHFWLENSMYILLKSKMPK